MGTTIFYSYKPYLQIAFKEHGLFIVFSADCSYIPQNELELKLLREYAEATKSSHIISGSMPPDELQSRHEAFEDRLVQEAEARLEAQTAAEKERKEKHDFYSILRMSDKVGR